MLSLPPEIIEDVLDHLLELVRRERQPASADLARRSPRMLALDRASQICRAWRAPAQRRLVERLIARWGSEAARVERELVAGDLGACVRELRIQSFYQDMRAASTSKQLAADDGVTPEALVRLLDQMPRLRVLDLRFVGFRTLVIPEEVRLRPLLENLRTLRVASAAFDATHHLAHLLLAFAPNLESLVLELNQSVRRATPTHDPIPPPVDLIYLRSLTFDGSASSSAVLLPTLFSPETMSRVTTLGLQFVHGAWELDHLLPLIPNVTRAVHRSRPGHEIISALYTQLPRLQEAGYYRPSAARDSLPDVPSSIVTLTFVNVPESIEALGYLRQSNKWPSGLKRVRVGQDHLGEAFGEDEDDVVLERLCAKEGLELVGTSYRQRVRPHVAHLPRVRSCRPVHGPSKRLGTLSVQH